MRSGGLWVGNFFLQWWNSLEIRKQWWLLSEYTKRQRNVHFKWYVNHISIAIWKYRKTGKMRSWWEQVFCGWRKHGTHNWKDRKKASTARIGRVRHKIKMMRESVVSPHRTPLVMLTFCLSSAHGDTTLKRSLWLKWGEYIGGNQRAYVQTN